MVVAAVVLSAVGGLGSHAAADEGDLAPPAPRHRPPPPSVTGPDAPWVLPTMPGACDAARAASGDVAGCLLVGPGGTNGDRGFGTPPFPVPEPGAVLEWIPVGIGDVGDVVADIQRALVGRGATIDVDGRFGPATEAAVRRLQRSLGMRVDGVVRASLARTLGVERRGPPVFPPSGWVWRGWGYNMSPALAGWEEQMVPSRPVPGFDAGRVRAHRDVIALFEGFMGEMTALGYDVTEIGSYVFRCTSGTGKTCAGRTPSSLSNHSWGLALDMNTAANPELTYRAADGVSACARPMITDIPYAVVRAAERWGLYWGGYGWGGGCSSAAEWRWSIHRDPMHVEFRGDVATARAIAAHNAEHADPQWCGEVADVVDDPLFGSWAVGAVQRCWWGSTPPRGTVLALDAAPRTASAVSVVVTGSATRPGTLRAARCDGPLVWQPVMRLGTTPATVTALLEVSALAGDPPTGPTETARGRICLRLPRGATVRVDRVATWSASAAHRLGPVADVAPVVTSDVEVSVPAEPGSAAVWLEATAATTGQVTTGPCPLDGRASTWWATRRVASSTLVATAPAEATEAGPAWCASSSAPVTLTAVADLAPDGESGLVPATGDLRGDLELPAGATSVLVRVDRLAAGARSVGLCRSGERGRGARVGDQVAWLLLDVPPGADDGDGAVRLCDRTGTSVEGMRGAITAAFVPEAGVGASLNRPRRLVDTARPEG